MLASITLGLALLAPRPLDFYPHTPYDPRIPRPETILQYQIGDRHTVFRDQEQVVLNIATAAKDRVVQIDYGRSTEGRPLRVFAISSPENIARLAEIQTAYGQLANPQPNQNHQELLDKTPALVWINQCIHGDETASFESAMPLIYNLAASQNPRITETLKNAVVIVNPVYNPDGHERYVVAYNSIPNGHAERGAYDQSLPSAFYGRSNHYRFDMNRDRIAMSQAETRQEVALFLSWNPHVYVDQHGQTENYFFPPVQQSLNINVGRERYNQWTETFGRATASAFDQQGWTYYIKDQFDFYNVCYLDTHTTLMGAIGMTHETDGGRLLVRKREDDTLLTMRQGAEKHFVSALAVIESAAQNRQSLLASYLDYKTKAVSGQHAGKFRRVVLKSEDPRELLRLQAHLDRSGIVSRFAGKSWTQNDATDYWTGQKVRQEFPAGSLVVDLAQSQGPLAKALLEPFSEFEPEFIARQKAKALADKEGRPFPEIDGFEFYDSTAWALPYLYNLQAWWCESTPPVQADFLDRNQPPLLPSPVGYALRYSDQEDILAAARALQNGIKTAFVTKPIKIDGQTYEPGTFLFLAARNPENLQEKLQDLQNSSDITLVPLKTSYPDEGREGPGSGSVRQLRTPKIGVLFGRPGDLRMGALWYLLEKEFRLPYVALSDGVNAQILADYTTIVVSSPSQLSTPTLQAWIEQGGTAVALSGLESADFELESQSLELDLPGALFRAELNPQSFLTHGYRRDQEKLAPIAVPVDGSRFATAANSPVTLPANPETKKLLSGWVWDDTETGLANAAWAHEIPKGRGRIVAFAFDPSYRAQYPGLHKLLLNAIILGPSL